MKRIHIDDYKYQLHNFIKKHGEYKETSEFHEGGSMYKELAFADGVNWYEFTSEDGVREFWNAEDNVRQVIDDGAENEWLHLGGGFSVRLNERYAAHYESAHFHLTKNGRYMKVELYSRWNSSYNQVRFFTVANLGTPINIMAEFLQ